MASRKVKKSKFTKDEILAIVKMSSETNKTNSVKSHYTDNGAQKLADAIAHAFTIPTLSSVGITNAKSQGNARREFCKNVGATLLDPSKVMRSNTSSRPENGLDQRLMIVAGLMGLDAKTFYAVRSVPTNSPKQAKVFIVRR